MNTFQTTLAYVIAALTLTAFLWACVRALRKRFAGEPCTGYPDSSKTKVSINLLPLVAQGGVGTPYRLGDGPFAEADREHFTGYIKSLSDEDLWDMKGLSKPLAKIRKTEMDVRRRRKARATAARRDVIGHTPDGRTVFFDHNGSPTLRDPLGWDANGSPAVDDNVQAALTE